MKLNVHFCTLLVVFIPNFYFIKKPLTIFSIVKVGFTCEVIYIMINYSILLTTIRIVLGYIMSSTDHVYCF